jgi:hypothetical protein
MSDRPETGPMQFGDDWCGIFIRGDNAFFYANALKNFLESKNAQNDIFTRIQLEGLVELLASCMGNPKDAIKLQELAKCLPVAVQLLK